MSGNFYELLSIMVNRIEVKEASLEEVVLVNSTITEFGEPYSKEYFAWRYDQKEHLLIVAYIESQPAWYVVGYDAYNDGSFYCWMAGVCPEWRGKGVLKALMLYQDTRAKEKGYNKIKIKTRNNKRAMLSYLVKYWFNFTEVIPQEDIGLNRILLEKDL